jgi:hypothetical protein
VGIPVDRELRCVWRSAIRTSFGAHSLTREAMQLVIVFISGQNDAVNVDKDAASGLSMLEWCVFDWYAERSPWTGHEVAGSTVLGRAFDMLEKHAEPKLARLKNCRLHINEELGKQIEQANDLLAAGNVDGARKLLNKIDTRYGGLAAPRSVDLAARIVGME